MTELGPSATDHATLVRGSAAEVRYTSLDGLRGVAALVVIFFHVQWPNHLTGALFFRNSYMAVDLFFLLSGFVIAASYGHRVGTRAEAWAFLLRRFFRVYPLHAAILLLLSAQEAVKFVALARGLPLNQAPFTGVSSGWTLLANVLFVQGSGLVPASSWNPPAWTVSSEFFAYLAFAAAGVAGLVGRRGLVLAVACAGAVAYGLMAAMAGTLDLTAHGGILRCFAGFTIGMALYQGRHGAVLGRLAALGAGPLTALELGAVAAVVIALGTLHDGAVVVALPCFVVLLALLQRAGGAVSRLLAGPLCQWLGLISYSVYLVHVPVRTVLLEGARRFGLPTHYPAGGGGMVLDIAPLTGDLLLAALIALAVAVACVTFRWIEEPGRLLGRRLSASRRTPVADRAPRTRPPAVTG